MAWFKVDTSFFRNKKIVNLSANAKLFYLAGLATCADQRTNGEISANLLPVLCPDFHGMKKIRSLCEELVAAGLWVVSEGGFQVHGYLEYQRSADSIDREKEAGKKRQQQFRNGVTKNSVTVTDRIDREIEREIEDPLTGDPLSLSSQEKEITPLPQHETVGDRLCESGHKLLRGQPAKFCATCRQKPPIVLLPERDPNAEENARIANELGIKIMRGEDID